MTPTQPESEALAWMAAEGTGYKAAARKFNVDPERLKAIRRARTGTPARETPTPAPDVLSRRDWLIRELAAVARDLEAAREAGAFTAVSTLHNAQRQMRKALDEELTALKAAGNDDDQDDAELKDIIITSLTQMQHTAPAKFREIAQHCDDLRTGPKLVTG